MGHEYIFFDQPLVQQFVAFLDHLGIASEVRADVMGGWAVHLPAELPDATDALIEAENERLMCQQRDLVNAADASDGANEVMGVEVALTDGETCWVRLPADLGRRLSEHFSFEEIHQLVRLVAEQALQPLAGPICRKI
jgi:hypothetical protein